MLVFYRLSQNARARHFVSTGHWWPEFVRDVFSPENMQPEERQELIDLGLDGREMFAVTMRDDVVTLKPQESVREEYYKTELVVLDESLMFYTMMELLRQYFGSPQGISLGEPIPGLVVAK